LCPLFEIIIVSFMNRSRGEKDALAKVLSHLKVGCSSASAFWLCKSFYYGEAFYSPKKLACKVSPGAFIFMRKSVPMLVRNI